MTTLSLLYWGLLTLVTYRTLSIGVEARARKQLSELYLRRGLRFQHALNSGPSTAPAESSEAYAFSGWVELLPDAQVQVAGQTFNAAKEAFEVCSLDERSLSRAKVKSSGDGTLHIHSHGQFYRAYWSDEKWLVDQTSILVIT